MRTDRITHHKDGYSDSMAQAIWDLACELAGLAESRQEELDEVTRELAETKEQLAEVRRILVDEMATRPTFGEKQ